MDESLRILKAAQAFAKAQRYLVMAKNCPLTMQRAFEETTKELTDAYQFLPESVRELIDEAAQTCGAVVNSDVVELSDEMAAIA